jgi:hypothetical protein
MNAIVRWKEQRKTPHERCCVEWRGGVILRAKQTYSFEQRRHCSRARWKLKMSTCMAMLSPSRSDPAWKMLLVVRGTGCRLSRGYDWTPQTEMCWSWNRTNFDESLNISQILAVKCPLSELSTSTPVNSCWYSQKTSPMRLSYRSHGYSDRIKNTRILAFDRPLKQVNDSLLFELYNPPRTLCPANYNFGISLHKHSTTSTP